MSDEELMRDGERWQAFAATVRPSHVRLVACASCETVNADPVNYVDPRTARVEPWYVTGDVRVFVFVCNECAAAGDEYDDGHGFEINNGMVMHCGAWAWVGDDWAECKECDAVATLVDIGWCES